MSPEGKLDKHLLGLYIVIVLAATLIVFTEHVALELGGILVVYIIGVLTDEHVKSKRLTPMIQPQKPEKPYL